MHHAERIAVPQRDVLRAAAIEFNRIIPQFLWLVAAFPRHLEKDIEVSLDPEPRLKRYSKGKKIPWDPMIQMDVDEQIELSEIFEGWM